MNTYVCLGLQPIYVTMNGKNQQVLNVVLKYKPIRDAKLQNISKMIVHLNFGKPKFY
jgi:hypothetical protein